MRDNRLKSTKGLTESNELERVIDHAADLGGDPHILNAAQAIIRRGSHCTRGVVQLVLTMVSESLEDRPKIDEPDDASAA